MFLEQLKPSTLRFEDADPVRVLYISYDGLLEPLGQSQILPYLEQLSGRRIELFLLTYEKGSGRGDHGERTELRDRLRKNGIRWTSLRYHKSPALPATLYDVAAGVVVGAVIAGRRRVHIVHARSYVSALIALILKQIFGIRFLFDMRGFWADERIEGGIWRSGGWLYRAAKVLERAYLTRADGVVSLTEAAKAEIEAFDYLRERCPRITVIPTCVDLDRFQVRGSSGAHLDAGPGTRFTLVYSGSLGTWYLLNEMVKFFVVLKRRVPDAQFLILTLSPRHLVESAARKYGLGEGDLSVRSVPFQRMPEGIASGTAGVFFASASWANRARCPTKLAEFLALGIPVVVSRGIGDVDAIVSGERVGVVVEQLSEAAYEKSLVTLLGLLGEGGLRERCRQAAKRYFSLQLGVLKYLEVYQTLSGARRRSWSARPGAEPIDRRY